MKKYFLLAVLMMVVFLWWGNYSMGQTEQNISQCSDYDNEWIEAVNWSCSGWYTPESGPWGMLCCNPNPVWWTWAFCVDTPNSILNNDPHAIVTTVGILCKCMPGYGEYYDTDLNKTTCQPCSRKDVCCGVKLNTNVPFIGNCLEQDTSDPSAVSPERAFPVLMSSLTKILVTVILIVSFVLIVVGGIMIASAWANQSRASEWRKLIMKVVVGIALLGASGVILRLINPNFFG